jgi:hypothetical protein
MAGRDTRSPDPDDWFAEPERAPSRRVRPAAPQPEPDDDDWVADERRARPQRPSFAASLPDNWVPLAAGVLVVVVLLVGGLALAGVFNSSKPTRAATTNQITSTPTTTAATTTARTTTQAAGPTVTAPTTTLKPGDTGAQVKALQRALAALGYTVGKVDGDYGTSTETAVGQFQTAQKLTPDGVFGPATRAALIKALKSG